MLHLVDVRKSFEGKAAAQVTALAGITLRIPPGQMAAVMGPSKSNSDLEEIFAAIEKIRKKAKPHPGVTTKDLIEEGRR